MADIDDAASVECYGPLVQNITREKETSMADAQRMTKRNFDAPDETRPAGSGKADVVGMSELTIMRTTLPPGWRWSQDVQPVAKTASCQAPHMLYMLSGRLHTVMDDGSEQEFGPGDLGAIPPGHDAWVVGNAPVVVLDITGAGVWAKPQ